MKVWYFTFIGNVRSTREPLLFVMATQQHNTGLTPENAKAIFAELFQDGTTPYEIGEKLKELSTFAFGSNDADAWSPRERGNMLNLIYQLNKVVIAAHSLAEPVN